MLSSRPPAPLCWKELLRQETFLFLYLTTALSSVPGLAGSQSHAGHLTPMLQLPWFTAHTWTPSSR